MSHFAAIVKPPRPLGRFCRPLWAAGVSLAITALTPQAFAACQYVVNDQWGGGFTATIKVTNSGTAPVSGWNINWRYNGADRITSSWNVTMSGSNPYTASNVGWNGNLQPNQTVEFGVQGSKGSAPAELAVISGAICDGSASSSPTSSAPASSRSSTVTSSSNSSAPAVMGCGNNTLFCLDFENTAPGTIPSGFTQEGNGIAVVQGQEARSGNRSVKFTSTNASNYGYFKKNSVSGTHWGRLYYKMKTPVPNINTWLHGTFVTSRGNNAEFRFVDTVQEASGKHQYIYNVEPGDVSLQGAYAYNFDSSWVCTEWYVNHQTQTYRFFRNGEELFFTNGGRTTGATNLPGFAAVPASLDWLGFGFRSYQQSGGIEGWIDDVAVGGDRIGCSTPNTSSASSSSIQSTNRAPIATAGGPGTSIHTFGSASFSGDGSDPDGDPLTFRWTLGSEVLSTARSFSYTFTQAGSYSILLTVTDDKGASGTTAVSVQVFDWPGSSSSKSSGSVSSRSSVSSDSSIINVSSSSRSSLPQASTWSLNPSASYLNFVTTKNTNVIEAHGFDSLSGGISDTGTATLVINLSSVNTGIALRDQRMRDLLFEVVSFPNATVTLAVPNGLLTNLAVGSTSEIDVTATLNLHGVDQPLATRVSVQKLTNNRVLVQNLTPVLVSAADYDLSNGVEALRAAVAIASISKAVPVDFTLVFDAR